MYIDKGYYIGKLNAHQDGLRDKVLDYLCSFLSRRDAINKEIPVELIRRHCEQTLQAEIPMDTMIGALLYDNYNVADIKGEWYAGIGWDCPIGKMKKHKRIDKRTVKALHSWYGDLIDPATSERYDLQ